MEGLDTGFVSCPRGLLDSRSVEVFPSMRYLSSICLYPYYPCTSIYPPFYPPVVAILKLPGQHNFAVFGDTRNMCYCNPRSTGIGGSCVATSPDIASTGCKQTCSLHIELPNCLAAMHQTRKYYIAHVCKRLSSRLWCPKMGTCQLLQMVLGNSCPKPFCVAGVFTNLWRCGPS